MKRNDHIFIFVLFCCIIICMMSLPAAAHADSFDSAKAAIVTDPRTGTVLYAHDEHKRMPMASTTKIMTALIALESGDLDEPFTVDSSAVHTEGSSMGLCEGDTVTMRDLVCGMLLPSGNDAANAAAVRISGSVPAFVEKMNERAAQMGLKDTHFVTPSGLDDYTDDHYSTAFDMAKLAAEALKNPGFAAICSQQSATVRFGCPPYERRLFNSNKLLGMCDGVIGVKTGFTDKAGRCLVSACERDGAELICVTLGDRNDWHDHSALYERCFARMVSVSLEGSGKEYDIPLAGGETVSMTAVAAPVSLKLPDTAVKDITAKVSLDRIAFAPVKTGERVGAVKYFCGSRLIYELPITAAEDAQAKRFDKSEWKKLMRSVDDMLGSGDEKQQRLMPHSY